MLEEKNIKYKPVLIKSGKNNDELWQNFNTIFEEFDNEDDVYVDITHSFRSIPIIFMAVLNYAANIKNIHIHGIFYGAYEAKHKKIVNGVELEVAPIFNLTLFNEIQEWTKSVEKFLTTADARKFSEKIIQIKDYLFKTNNDISKEHIRNMEKIAKALNTYSEDLLSSRVKYIVEDAEILKKRLQTIDLENVAELSPFIKVLGKVSERLEPFSGDIVEDSIYAIRQCVSYQLVQQAYTMLQETITTALSIRMGIDFKKKNERKVAESIKQYFNHPNDYSGPELGAKEQHYIERAGKDFIIELSNLAANISDFRNDLNHAGFSDDTGKIKMGSFKKSLSKSIDKFENILSKYPKLEYVDTDAIEDKLTKKVRAVSILSHKLIEGQIKELREVWKVDEIITMPDNLKILWGQVDPNGEVNRNKIKEFENFIKHNTDKDDYVIVQGESGMTVAIVNLCFKLNRIPIYSTTERKAFEISDGDEITVTRSFKHVRFRKYIQ